MRPCLVLPALLIAAASSGSAFAQGEGPSERTLGTTSDGKRIVSLVIYGNDSCPEGKDGEIVVCARQPETERYRLPKTFRKSDGKVEKSWKDQASTIDTAGNAGIGSCSAVGSGGATGCNREMMRSAKQERKQKRAEDAAEANQISNP